MSDPPPKSPAPSDVAKAFDPNRLRQLMRLFGFATVDLAYRMNVNTRYLASLLSGIQKPTAADVISFAQEFGYPAHFFGLGRPQIFLDSSEIPVCGERNR